MQDYLVKYHRAPRTASIFQEYSYFTPISYKDRILTEKQARTVVTIRKKIQQHHLVFDKLIKVAIFILVQPMSLKRKVNNSFLILMLLWN